MIVPRIALAMRYIDDELITDSVSYRSGSVKFFWLKLTGCAACAMLLLTIAVMLPFSLRGSHAEDSRRMGVCEKITDLHDFSETCDNPILGKLADYLRTEENLQYSVELWYDENGSSDDPKTWNTLITDAGSDEYSLSMCSFFSGDVESHKVSLVFSKKNTRVVNINGTTVLIAPHPLSGEPIIEWGFGITPFLSMTGRYTI